MTVKDHEHNLIKLKEDVYIPFENDPHFKYSQHHCKDDDCDYHEFRHKIE